MESERPIEWQVKGIDLDKENRPVYEIEIRRDGIDNNFVPIENFMNRISKQGIFLNPVFNEEVKCGLLKM